MYSAPPKSVEAAGASRPVDDMVTDGFRQTCDRLTSEKGVINAQLDLLEMCRVEDAEDDTPMYDLEMVRDLIVYLTIIRGVYVTAVKYEIREFDFGFSDQVAIKAAQLKAGIDDASSTDIRKTAAA